MSQSIIQFQRDWSLPQFLNLYSSEQQFNAAYWLLCILRLHALLSYQPLHWPPAVEVLCMLLPKLLHHVHGDGANPTAFATMILGRASDDPAQEHYKRLGHSSTAGADHWRERCTPPLQGQVQIDDTYLGGERGLHQ